MKVGTRVLLVDNNPAAIDPIQARLVGLGCAVTLIHDGAQGIEAARRDRPDLAVLDAVLPEVNGYQVCRELKRLERPPVVVMLSARSEPADRFWAVECGADLFLTRPIDPEVFVLQVAALLGER